MRSLTLRQLEHFLNLLNRLRRGVARLNQPLHTAIQAHPHPPQGSSLKPLIGLCCLSLELVGQLVVRIRNTRILPPVPNGQDNDSTAGFDIVDDVGRGHVSSDARDHRDGLPGLWMFGQDFGGLPYLPRRRSGRPLVETAKIGLLRLEIGQSPFRETDLY
jgi:hypothetical protein